MSRTKVMAVLAAVLCLPAATIAWLGLRLIEQDRALAEQRSMERREQAAERAVQTLTAIVNDSALFTNPPGEGALLVHPDGRGLLFRMNPPMIREAPNAPLAAAEALEFRGDLASAAAAYEKLPPAAGVLMRLGRTLGRLGRIDAALAAYGRLSALVNEHAGEWPAPVAAAWSRCLLLQSRPQLRQEAQRFRALLDSGRYPLSEAAYTAFADDAARWIGVPRPAMLERLTRAAQSETAVDQITVLKREGARLAVTREFIEREWLPKAGPGVWLREFGAPKAGAATIRHPAETKLPWTVMAAPSHDAGQGRERLLIVLLGTVGLFTVGGSFFGVRAVRRELALARMQEDFVAAVSHEFRTPLTTIRQIAEVLEDGRLATEERRQSYYHSLGVAADRLQRLVEDLLDFRRVSDYRRAPLDVRPFSVRVVDEFSRVVAENGFRVEVGDVPEAVINADGEAVGRALWNLLDNAVKYSGASREVAVNVRVDGGAVKWDVRDHGIGIAAGDRTRIFDQFYRAESARRAGIRGTGIGLAIVAQIAKAHGGRVDVEPAAGEGSVFTLTIPMEDNNGPHPDRRG